MTVPSPCKNLCALDPVTRICLGCGRTLQEIGLWSRMSDTEKRAVLDRLEDAAAEPHA